MNPEQYRIPTEHLRSSIDLSHLEFETTEDIPSLDKTIGQDRAVNALTFGLRMDKEGYNIYAAGIPGTGKSTLVKDIIMKLASEQKAPDDWCYLYNFERPEHPCAVRLCAGEGHQFHKEMNQLVQFIKKKIPEVFQSKEYAEERDQIIEKGERAKQALFQEITEKSRDLGFNIKSTRTGFTIVPVKKGKPLRQEELNQLSPEEQKEIENKQKEVSDLLKDLIHKYQKLDKETEEELDKFNQDAASFSLEGRFLELQEQYKEHERISQYLKEVYRDILQNVKEFLPSSKTPLAFAAELEGQQESFSIRYQVNLVVDNMNTQGAPLIIETNPTYANLVGRIEKRSRFGTLRTDFTLIRPGSILKANGGYLVLNIMDLLTHPFCWEALKKAIENKELLIEDVGELYGIISTIGMRPEPIPVDLKVVVLGNPEIYGLLQDYDEDFSKLFKVKADFSTSTRRTDEEVQKYIHFTAKVCRDEGLKPFDKSALTELLRLISRMVEHKERLSLQFDDVSNLIREASFWASEDGADIVTAGYVSKAFEEKVYRSNLLEERIQDVIDEGVLMVDVDQTKIGQVNGLAVYSVGDYAFGKPARITSRTYLGRKGVINVERESELSGKTHSKGVMILTNYLGGRYAQEHPLSLSASLAFEQSYDEIDGDSASAAELIAILSSLAEIPLKQNIAVTGSINQHGEMQPIGGVNEKIEGFFQTCRNRGLTGTQGVVIPYQNVKHLCLSNDVVKAVEDQQFHIYQVRQIDEALELLTGMEAGSLQEDGTFTSGSVNARVEEALSKMHDRMEENGEAEEEEEEGEEADG